MGSVGTDSREPKLRIRLKPFHIVTSAALICFLPFLFAVLTDSRAYQWHVISPDKALEVLTNAASSPINISPPDVRAAETTIDGNLYVMIMRFTIPRQVIFAIATAFDMQRAVHDPFDPSLFPGGSGAEENVPPWFARWRDATKNGVGTDLNIAASGIVDRNYRLSFVALRAEESEDIVLYVNLEMPVFVRKRDMAAARGRTAVFYACFDEANGQAD